MYVTKWNTVEEENPATFLQPACQFLFNYWTQKRGVRSMPSRADIVPGELKKYLGWIMLLDVLPGARDFRYRLVGTLVTAYFFADSTGRTVREAFNEAAGPAAAEPINATYEKTARNKVVMRAFGNADWLAVGMEAFESIYLPLSDDGGETVSHILHAFVFDQSDMFTAREIARSNGLEGFAVVKRDG